ncbi:uncharacterized protein Z518_03065 [Rhinocladiella mackenziei CBS 650.93]|uniref:Uncharacterized protein n=1 Tax=Rhinocladiella mackenziei CBS 650.93 TaxID=1442369 RepID=A0A0D2IR08_9EURO|nr:uncharacterized protein Z518_03065 [Rhinocladiella mackenziei CBS 650.93]KIX08409.1 hypothetical protein Z518_03065 [Rhinocladiella mackenziei CBS 650.93]
MESRSIHFLPPSLVTCAVLLLSVASLIYYWSLRHRGRRRDKFHLGEAPEEEKIPRSSTEIRPLLDLDVASTNPHPYRPWKSGKFVMSMGIQQVKHEEWLWLDNRYWEEQELRRHLLETQREGVFQMLPGSEAACSETLQLIVDYVTKRFPHLFFIMDDKPDYLHNKLTGLTFKITEPYDMPPLQIAAQLVMEDLNVLARGHGGDPDQYYLVASFSMAPAGWHLEERIGWPLWKIHSPVPLWQDTIRKSVERYFLKMKPDCPIARHNFFIQTNDVLFQQDPFLTELPGPPKVEDIRLRHERQTLRRLPKTEAILFTVRTYMTPLLELQDDIESVRELLGAIRAMPPEMARYKGWPMWGKVVERWCEQRLRGAKREPVNDHGNAFQVDGTA